MIKNKRNKMPRTKVAKNTTKRNHDATKEKAANKIRDFDAQVESLLSDLENDYKCDLENVKMQIDLAKSRIPEFILSMTLKDLRNCNAKLLADISLQCNNLQSQSSTSSLLNTISSSSSIRQLSRDDEGYLTEGGGSGSSSQSHSQTTNINNSQLVRPPLGTGGNNQSTLKKKCGRPPGTRRSKSCNNFDGNSTTTLAGHQIHPSSGYLGGGGVNGSAAKLLLTGGKARGVMTPSHNGGGPIGTITHSSRARFRTPMTNNRIKSISVDSGLNAVTPKVQLNTPLAMLRYAKAGEQVISLSGSPVIASMNTQDTANVNIPIENGVLSLRPTFMQSIDRELLTRIDNNTLLHLKQLQTNLNLIMAAADENAF